MGQFKNDLRSGYGIQKWPDGRVYEGEWLNDEFHGKGKSTWADGRIYEGDYKKN